MILLSSITQKSQPLNFLGMAFQLIFLILIFIFVIFLAYYSTKFIANAKIKNMTKNNMKIIETISIGFNYVHIIQVNKQYFLISSSKEGIRILTEIDGKDLIINENNSQSLPFEKYLKQYFNNTKEKGKKGGKYEE
ncbi:flagellar biosynthetic protein FliO [[Clostridium] colinum]|uniref:flagellar biosynthetic protein FliO n=1 Tax=[Clostridium] colinum TaxID=36835 RepID=UPI0020245F1A|nr:flagellar biosynthetic protein FliO [[Clostridium] colinum]